MLMGLALTAAFGLWMVGSLNPISVAFAVLFVGIGVDFGIQYSVRYREERYRDNDLRQRPEIGGRARQPAADPGRGGDGCRLLSPSFRPIIAACRNSA